MGNPFKIYIQAKQVWCCSRCNAHLTDHTAIVSKQFQGLHGRGYLFSLAENVYCGKQEHRTLSTGRHIVCDIYCRSCNQGLGWKYVKAYVAQEQYKEDKYLLERARIERDGAWNEHYAQQEKEIAT